MSPHGVAGALIEIEISGLDGPGRIGKGEL
jgi:hypothetical protein